MRPWRYARRKTQGYDLVAPFVEIEVLDNCGVCLCCFVGCTPSAGLSGPECCRMEELSSKIRHERIQNFSSQLHSAIVLQFISLKQGILRL
jgi:hypothetical protein